MALADALHGLLRLPGATYSCVVERDSGHVLAEAGNGEGGAGDGEGVVPYSVARWGTAVAAMFEATSGDELDDVMITGRRSYHLLRALGPTASILVYLRLDRTRSNLAAARRELATVRWGASAPRSATGPPTAAPPNPARDAGVPARGLRATASLRSAGGGEARAARSSTDDPPRSAPAPAARATRVPAALPPRGTPARGLPSARADPARADPARADPARAGTPQSGTSRSATAGTDGSRGRTTSDATATDAAPAAPPAAPPRTDGDTQASPTGTPVSRPAGKPDQPARKSDQPARGPQIPLPRRSPGQRSPLTRPSAQGGDTNSRRRGGARGDSSGVPDGFPVPAVLGQSWARDPGTLRRLIAGLRRMS